MNEKRRYGILWSKSFLSFAQFAWGLTTYVILLVVTMVMAVRLGCGDLIGTAVIGVFAATGLNWFVFMMVEHGDLKRMNQ